MRRVVSLLALIVPLLLAAPAAPAAHKPARVDWRAVVDFAGSDLDPYSAADAALLQTLEPSRMRDPVRRLALQRQLSALQAAQAGLPKAARLRVASPAGVQTIDPGCQLTSSNPDGYDLCGYDSSPDVMSRWIHTSGCPAGDREHHMWTGVQESDSLDSGGFQQWRGWWKSRAVGCQGTDVNHYLNPTGFEVWFATSGTHPVGDILAGPVDQPAADCLPLCYRTGSWHSQLNVMYGDKIVRDYVEITGTSDTSSTNNAHYSMWWDRDGCACSSYPGPNNYVP